MARFDLGSFAGSFAQSFQQAQQVKTQRKLQQDELKAKTKLFELQLQKEQMGLASAQDAAQAREQLLGLLGPRQVANPVPTMLRPPGAPETVPGEAVGILDLLADPRNQELALRAGLVKPDDIMAQEGARANRAMVERLMGGGGAAGGMELTGVKIGPNGALMPDFGLPQVTTQTVDTPQGPRIASFNVRTGQKMADIGAAQPERITPEQGGRIQALQQAQSIVPKLRESFLGKDGQINRAAVLSTWSNAPFSKGRTLRAQIEDAMDAVIRARTGAAVTKEELEGTLRQFQPHPLDSDDTIRDKIARLEQFVSGTIDVTTLPPRIRQQMEQQTPQGGGGKVIDFSELPD